MWSTLRKSGRVKNRTAGDLNSNTRWFSGLDEEGTVVDVEAGVELVALSSWARDVIVLLMLWYLDF